MTVASSTGWRGLKRTADLGEVRLRYLLEGSGPPVVLLHGWPQTSHEWRHVIAPLAEHHTVVAPDLRGLGDSSRPASGYDKRTIGADVWALLDLLGLQEDVAVVGHDLGAAVAYRVAVARPEAVSRLAVLEMMMPGFGVEEELGPRDEDGIWHLAFHMARDVTEALVEGRERLYLAWFFRSFAHHPGAVGEADLDEYVRCYSQPGALRAGFEWYRALFEDGRHNRQSAQVPLEMPVLVLGGASSMGSRPAASVRNLARDVTAHVVPDCGHWIPEEQPDLLARVLTDFLAGRPAELPAL